MSATDAETLAAPPAPAVAPAPLARAARWVWTLVCAALGVALGGVIGVIVGLLTGLIPFFC